MTRLRIGMGASEAPDPGVAGGVAAQAAVAGLDGERPAIVIGYASARYHLPAALAAIRSVTGPAPLVGASSNGQFSGGRLVPPGTGVSVLALSAGDYHFGVASATGLADHPFDAGRELARTARTAVGENPPPHSTLLILADGLSGADLPELLSGVYRVAGAGVPVVGGVAACEQTQPTSSVFHDDSVLRDAAVALWIASEHPLRVCSAHGWRPEGLPMLVTRSEGLVVSEIAGKPAIEVFRGCGTDTTPSQEPNWEYHNSTHAFGLVEPDGTQAIRSVFIDRTGTVRTLAPLPPYAAIRVVSCTPDALLEISEQVMADSLVGHRPSVVLAFSCTGRMTILGDRAHEEPERLQAAAGEVPTFGFYTFGEFARTTSVAGYHNATITTLAL